MEHYRIMARRFGMFLELIESRNPERLEKSLRKSLTLLEKRGWAVPLDGDGQRCWELTGEGRREAELMLEELRRNGRFIEKGTAPETVSMVTLVVHFLLAAVKLPAAVLSGSVGLLNDGLDTLMDGVSSLFVFFGVRSGRERLASYVLLGAMSLTGLYTLYEAVMRFIHPRVPEIDLLTFLAVIVSALLCSLLWLYQKYAGLTHNSVPLIAQSIDSRNHVIVAAGVTAGLVASLFSFPLLDRLVGIAVAVLILKAAAELLVDLVRSGDEELDLQKYGFTMIDRHRHEMMIRWFLYEIAYRDVSSVEELQRRAHAATDFRKVASLEALGLHEYRNREEKIEEAIDEIFSRGWAVKEPLSLTEEGLLELESSLHGSVHREGSASMNEKRRRARTSRRLEQRPLQLIVLLMWFTTGAAVFFPISLVLRYVVELLPPADLWDSFSPLFTLLLPAEVQISVTLPQIFLLLAGFILYLVGRRQFHRARHLIHHARERIEGKSGKETTLLVDEGPYIGCRHPMYASFITFYLAYALAIHSVYGLLLVPVLAAVAVGNAFFEERELDRRFGEEWREYKKRVGTMLMPAGWIAALALLYAAGWMGTWL
jgi:protein-S-isoprenylcysteine O-methyltransferase Ste14